MAFATAASAQQKQYKESCSEFCSKHATQRGLSAKGVQQCAANCEARRGGRRHY
jgi:hypothetical protein